MCRSYFRSVLCIARGSNDREIDCACSFLADKELFHTIIPIFFQFHNRSVSILERHKFRFLWNWLSRNRNGKIFPKYLDKYSRILTYRRLELFIYTHNCLSICFICNFLTFQKKLFLKTVITCKIVCFVLFICNHIFGLVFSFKLLLCRDKLIYKWAESHFIIHLQIKITFQIQLKKNIYIN